MNLQAASRLSGGQFGTWGKSVNSRVEKLQGLIWGASVLTYTFVEFLSMIIV